MATSGEASTVAATEMASSDEAPMMDLSDQNGGGKNGEQRQHSTNGTGSDLSTFFLCWPTLWERCCVRFSLAVQNVVWNDEIRVSFGSPLDPSHWHPISNSLTVEVTTLRCMCRGRERKGRSVWLTRWPFLSRSAVCASEGWLSVGRCCLLKCSPNILLHFLQTQGFLSFLPSV